jgi:polyhydroxybutyrate depolymerase
MKTYHILAGTAAIAVFPLFSGCLPQGDCSALKPGSYDCRVEHDGLQRRYLVYVPASYTGDTPVPLVVDLPGWGSPAIGQRAASGMEQLANEKGFIVAWPEGTGEILGFNGAGCCDLHNTGIDDVGFIRKVVSSIQTAANINTERTYATGLSGGGGMSYRLGCEAADIFSAIAPIAFSMALDFPCAPSRPISSFTVRSVEDWLVPFDGGPLGSTLPEWLVPFFLNGFAGDEDILTFVAPFYSSQQVFESWGAVNRCNAPVVNTFQKGASFCEQYSSCAEATIVSRCVVHGANQPAGGHDAYINDDNVPVSSMIWEFFDADYQRKQL